MYGLISPLEGSRQLRPVEPRVPFEGGGSRAEAVGAAAPGRRRHARGMLHPHQGEGGRQVQGMMI